MMNKPTKEFIPERDINDNIELMIDLLEGALQEEGYRTKRYSKTDIFKTTAYESLIVKRHDGEEFTLTINKRSRLNKQTGRWENTNDLV